VPPAVASFRDVQVGAPFHCYIEWLAEHGISTGWVVGGVAEYRPMASIERQAMAAFIYRKVDTFGVEGNAWFPTPGTSSFLDVPTTSNFHRHIELFADGTATTGFGTAVYPLSQPVALPDCQAMAAFIYRLAGSPTDFVTPATATFVDVPVGTPFFREIEWLATQGITTGWNVAGGVEFRPGAQIERQAMAAFMWRAVNLAQIPLDR
jgi:hypothetical protein